MIYYVMTLLIRQPSANYNLVKLLSSSQFAMKLMDVKRELFPSVLCADFPAIKFSLRVALN